MIPRTLVYKQFLQTLAWGSLAYVHHTRIHTWECPINRFLFLLEEQKLITVASARKTSTDNPDMGLQRALQPCRYHMYPGSGAQDYRILS